MCALHLALLPLMNMHYGDFLAESTKYWEEQMRKDQWNTHNVIHQTQAGLQWLLRVYINHI